MDKVISKKILEDKKNGLTDKDIGDKYGVNLKFIERVITKEIGVNLSLPLISKQKIKNLQPKNFNLEKATVWSFKSRGNWATHNGNYRGNWSPYIPRNVLLRYSKEGDTVLDYFFGAGTTGVECKLLNRNFIGIDINPQAIELAKLNLDFDNDSKFYNKSKILIQVGDARNLNFLEDNSINLICAHPPYANIINYTFENPADLSNFKENDFLSEISKVARESFRILKNNSYCAILIGDLRRNKNVIPLGFWTIERFLKEGFNLKDLIIKRQHNCKTTGFWYTNSIKYNFLLLAHEYLAIFKKISDKPKISEISQGMLFKKFKGTEKKLFQKIDLESTTVWIFSEKNWKEQAFKNLIQRYSSEHDYFIFKNTDFNKKYSLIISEYSSNLFNFTNFINEHLNSEGIFAIICEDIRLENELISSEALKTEQTLRNSNLFQIKEIVVVSLENHTNTNNKDNLEISHKYILIYKKK